MDSSRGGVAGEVLVGVAVATLTTGMVAMMRAMGQITGTGTKATALRGTAATEAAATMRATAALLALARCLPVALCPLWCR